VLTVQDVAKRLNKTKWAVYKMIESKKGVGKKFKKNEFGIWVVDGRKVK